MFQIDDFDRPSCRLARRALVVRRRVYMSFDSGERIERQALQRWNRDQDVGVTESGRQVHWGNNLYRVAGIGQ
jgi:hypothetical protein